MLSDDKFPLLDDSIDILNIEHLTLGSLSLIDIHFLHHFFKLLLDLLGALYLNLVQVNRLQALQVILSVTLILYGLLVFLRLLFCKDCLGDFALVFHVVEAWDHVIH